MRFDNIRNSPEYGDLENIALVYSMDNEMSDFNKKRVEEIARQYPEVWQAAKEDFEVFKYR